MKSSQILASILFGSFAAAAPYKRDLVTKTEMVLETVVVYTTVWDEQPIPEATTTAGGYFYEQPASSVEAKPTTSATPTPVNTPSPVQEPSSVYTPPVETPSPSSVVIVSSAAPASNPETSSAAAAPEPTTTEAAYTSTPVSSAAPAATTTAAVESEQSSGSSSTSTGEQYSGDITIYDNTGGLGACGKAITDSDMVVALAKPAWGASTYDVMTGEATNPWCGQKIKVEYNGKSIDATIMDMCPGCSGHDIDLSLAAWKALTGMDEKTRIQGTWSKASS